MNKRIKLIYSFLILTIVVVFCLNLFAKQNNQIIPTTRTEGAVDFQIRTSSYGGEYEPEHVFAIWVTDENDNFVRTLVRRAWEEIEDLVKWNNMTGGNYQNALVTGATLNSHQTHNLNWDCTDNLLASIPDGTYKIYIEFSEDDTNQGGPWTNVEFVKGPDPYEVISAGPNNFHDIELYYTPAAQPDPTIEITSPANNSTIEELPFMVEFVVENFDPAGGDGFVGLYIDDNLIQMYSDLNPVAVGDFPQDSHDLKLMLLDPTLTPLDPEVSDTVTLSYNPIANDNELVSASKLLGNYPNPFNPSTTIYFSVTQTSSFATIEIYNLKGQKVKTFPINSSTDQSINSITWNGTDNLGKPVSSGVYYYVLKSGDRADSRKMLLMK
ncbi:MAG: DUF2271 domain-containing protein [Candidatus Cloacimonetes bacterium]|nr:DUF2271 domain-containing protein [Candidatus Cloacimonadota bacterium]MCF7814001.1 DUF2271 domain-containing protein [Candidatus Cloacimonadota bacterium]MCF7868629.1 DUF2271 domain-containing protein [Candidatus Cloacimonadota bacterium]MCF7882858.1 DUF2271 domain-containing protein [Candidatus Cloacimonadota bacterium]